jgi:hypothetical protein
MRGIWRNLLSKEEKEKGIQLTIHLLLMPRWRRELFFLYVTI